MRLVCWGEVDMGRRLVEAAGTATAAGPTLRLLNLVDLDVAPVRLGAVEGLDARLRVGLGTRLDEGEAARAAVVAT